MDWAQKQIEELKLLDLSDADDSTKSFCAAYVDGDSVDAYNKFVSTASVHNFSNGQYFLAVFPDNSAYADWKQGLNSFYPDISDLIEEDEEVAALFEESHAN